MTHITATVLVKELRSQGAKLILDGDSLRCSAAKGVLTAEVLARLKDLKPEVLAVLRAEADSAASAAIPLTRIPRQDPLPVSFGQERLWFMNLLEPGAPAFNLSFSIRRRQLIDAEILERSLREVARRHEAFRTRFENHGGRPVTQINPEPELTLSVLELRGKELQTDEIERLLREEARRPFDLSTGPLDRWVLLRLNDTESILQLTWHHIISDHRSVEILFRDLSRVYKAFAAGQISPLLDRPVIDYVDFAHWQRQRLTGAVATRHLEYWKRQLSGVQNLDLPTDRPRPAIQSSSGRTESVFLSRALTDRVNKLARSEKATLFMTLLAALKILLYRYTGQVDLVVGSPFSGRNRVELEQVIGFFINTLVLRTDLSDDPTFREVVQRIKQVVLAAFAHQDTPFASLVERLHPERDLSRHPFYQVLFDLDNAPEQANGNSQRIGTSEQVDVGTANLDLSVFAATSPGGIELRWEYCTDLFDRGTILRFMKHYQVLLESVTADPDRPISQLEILDGLERQRLLVEWNDTARPYPTTPCLHELIEQQTDRTPDLPAVIFEDQILTYRQLDERANQLAWHLRHLGVGPEVVVGVFLQRSVEMIIALHGILKSGGGYVPLDPDYPTDRLAYMVADSATKVILTQADLVASLPESNAEIVVLDIDWSVIESQSPERPPVVTTPSNLAYIIYTSGSTGRPKGVMNAHRGIVNHLWMQEELTLDPSDRVMQKTPSSFDVSVCEFFWPFMAGAALVVARPGGHKDSAYLVNLIQEQAVTTVQFVPSMLRVFLEEAGVENCTSLRRVFCAGEALPHDMQERFFELLDGVELHNLYGPTEASVHVTWWQCRRNEKRNVVPIGKPIPNTQTYVLDPAMRPVPIGVEGELYLGGVQIARGYRNQPALTAATFVPDPFGNPGDRLYRTGDVTRFLPDGNIEFLGRTDHQVKVRGFRIELGEIEAALGEHPAIAQSVVVARGELEKLLVAYLVAADGSAIPNVSQLRELLGGTLPDYMVPAAFVFLDELPLMPNGKVNRRALPAPDTARPELEHQYVEPRTDLERGVAGIWQELLGVDRVGRLDFFFDLGGHSLLAIEAIAKMESRLGVVLHPLDLFNQTLGQLAASCERPSDVSAEAEPVSPPLVDETSPAPSQIPPRPGAEAAAVVASARSVDSLLPATSEALTIRRLNGTALQPFYFGPADAPLFGCFHLPPLDTANRRGVVLCNAVGHEYTRSHRAFRYLAERLAGSGLYVLRFDYFATGDSAGEDAQASTSRWIDDIASAVGELQRRTGVTDVSLIGRRLGAALAVLYAAANRGIDRLALWDPVGRGEQYLEELQRMHSDYVLAIRGDYLGSLLTPEELAIQDGNQAEFLGQSMTLQQQNEIVALDLAAIATSPAAASLVLDSGPEPKSGRIVERLTSLGVAVEREYLPDPQSWTIDDPLRQVVPNRILDTIVSWFGRGKA